MVMARRGIQIDFIVRAYKHVITFVPCVEQTIQYGVVTPQPKGVAVLV
jgi:hypothetical protein